MFWFAAFSLCALRLNRNTYLPSLLYRKHLFPMPILCARAISHFAPSVTSWPYQQSAVPDTIICALPLERLVMQSSFASWNKDKLKNHMWVDWCFLRFLLIYVCKFNASAVSHNFRRTVCFNAFFLGRPSAPALPHHCRWWWSAAASVKYVGVR